MKLGNQTERKIQKNKYMETKQHDTKNQWVHNEIKEEIRYKWQWITTLQNWWDAKLVLIGKFISDTGSGFEIWSAIEKLMNKTIIFPISLVL